MFWHRKNIVSGVSFSVLYRERRVGWLLVVKVALKAGLKAKGIRRDCRLTL